MPICIIVKGYKYDIRFKCPGVLLQEGNSALLKPYTGENAVFAAIMAFLFRS